MAVRMDSCTECWVLLIMSSTGNDVWDAGSVWGEGCVWREGECVGEGECGGKGVCVCVCAGACVYIP